MPSMPSSDKYIIDGKTDAERYLTAIYDGKIVTSVHMRRLADIMLPRFHEPYKDFHFDVKKALRPVQFIENFTCFPEGEKQGQPFELDIWQRAALELGFGFVDDDGYRQFRQVLMMVGRKNGKALSLDTEIPTPDGWKLMCDIHPGDYVFGQDGKPSRVVVESEIFDKPMYLVTFEDGAAIKASADHIWTVCDEYGLSRRDLCTEEMYEMLFYGGRYYVPTCQRPISYNKAVDGSSVGDFYNKGFAHSFGFFYPDENECDGIRFASATKRRAYIHGLVDGARHNGLKNPVADTKKFADFVAEVASSLGLVASVAKAPRLDSWSVTIEEKPAKAIVDIEAIPNEQSKCIAIDNKSHLYLAGRHYTSTHNSSLMAALALYFLTSDGEPGAEVLCIANSEQQARRVFGHADLMRRKSPALRDRIRRGMSQKRGTSGLNYDKNGSILVSIPANVATADGYSASAYIYDELGACTDMGAMLSAIEESVAGRRQASGWIISSENYVRHGIWDMRVDMAKDILAGKVVDDTLLPILYCLDTGDAYNDSSVFIKANPGLASGIKSMKYMEDRANAAANSPQIKSSFMTKDLCLRATSYTSFLTQEECHNPETFEVNPKTDRYGCLGFDLSSVGDLTACCCMFMRPGDDRIYEITHAWIPEAQVEIVNGAKDLKERDGVPYHLWASGDHPWMTIVPGDKIDAHQAILGFVDHMTELGIYIRYAGYDQWHVDDYLLRELHMRIGSSNCFKVQQNAQTLSPLMKEHRIDLRAHRIINPSPVNEFGRASVMAREDAAGNFYPNKKELKPQNKIDPYMAELFAYKMLKDNMDVYKDLIGWYPPQEGQTPNAS